MLLFYNVLKKKFTIFNVNKNIFHIQWTAQSEYFFFLWNKNMNNLVWACAKCQNVLRLNQYLNKKFEKSHVFEVNVHFNWNFLFVFDHKQDAMTLWYGIVYDAVDFKVATNETQICTQLTTKAIIKKKIK